MTKVDIISGFLGAGKTTLIKKLLKEALQGEKVVLIENEFGEIGIDGGFLKEAGIQITEMNSGCICCSLVGDFGTALKDVLTKFKPDRIVIEPSGVGKLSDVRKAVLRVQEEEPELQLNSLTTVADAHKCKMYMKNFGEFYNNQVETAQTIVLSRTGDIDQNKIEEVVAMLREKNPNATIITTDWEAIRGLQILQVMENTASLAQELMEEEGICPECGEIHDHEHEHHHHHDDDDECECGHEHHHHDEDDDDDDECGCGCGHDHDHHHHHHHHADEVFTSWGQETPKKFTEEEIRESLEILQDSTDYGTVLRAKGILPLQNGEWIHFDMVPGEYEIRHGAADYTGRLCVIGADLKTQELAKLFRL
jgi:G3E family GTPase